MSLRHLLGVVRLLKRRGLRHRTERSEYVTRHHYWLRIGPLALNHTDIALTITTRRYPKEPR